MDQHQKFIRRRAVQEITSLPSSTLYELMGKGLFPRPVALGGPKSVAWIEAEVLDWQRERIAERDDAIKTEAA